MTPYLVGIAGGSGAGKTVIAQAVESSLGSERVVRIGHDLYYCDRADLEPAERAALDFDAPEALDQERFRADLLALKRGERVVAPRYCFATHRRLPDGDIVEPRDVVLVEGILLYHDAAVRNVFDLRIWVDAPHALRLMRRLERDTRERGRTLESVLAQCRATVVPAHARYVEPTRVWADLVLVNAGRLEAAAEIAASVIRGRLERRGEPAGVRAA